MRIPLSCAGCGCDLDFDDASVVYCGGGEPTLALCHACEELADPFESSASAALDAELDRAFREEARW